MAAKHLVQVWDGHRFCLCMAAAASSKRRRTVCIYVVVYTLIRPLTGGVVLLGVVLLRLQRVALGRREVIKLRVTEHSHTHIMAVETSRELP